MKIFYRDRTNPSPKNSPWIQRYFNTPRVFFLVFSLLFLTPAIYENNAHAFLDEYGNEIIFPSDLPIYTQKAPGPWKENVENLEPKVVSWMRKSGLEDIRVLLIDLQNPFIGQEPAPTLKAVYILDKDMLMIGYQKFSLENPVAQNTKKFFVNGIINQIYLFAEYTDLGLWGKELRFEFQ